MAFNYTDLQKSQNSFKANQKHYRRSFNNFLWKKVCNNSNSGEIQAEFKKDKRIQNEFPEIELKKTKSNDFKEKRSEKSTDVGSNTDESEKLSFNTIHFNIVKKKQKHVVHNHAKLNLKLGDIIGQGIFAKIISLLIDLYERCLW